MSNNYHRINANLNDSLNHFEEVMALLGNNEAGQIDLEANAKLKERWFNTLNNAVNLSNFAKTHHRAQSPQVLAALEEVAKYTDVRRPFRLSVIGQKGVGKSALVNALLGASEVQYTPSEVAGKAVSGTRIRLMARNALNREDAPTSNWRVVFLTPRRLWEIGSHLLNVARINLPKAPIDLNNRDLVIRTLQEVLANTADKFSNNTSGFVGTTAQIQANNARETLAEMLKVYQRMKLQIPEDYLLDIDDANVDGPISPYIRQTDNNLYLIIDYVERYLEPEQAGLLDNRPIELEDVLGLDDPRDSFFALEAFKEAFAVIMVFKCDRGLNTESSSLLANLFSRNEETLATFGDYADLNKAIVVANQFDNVTANISGNSAANPLKGIEDIRRELSSYTLTPVPIYLTSAQMAQNARSILNGNNTRPSAAYRSYLDSLANLMQVLDARSETPDYLDFVLAKRAEIERLFNAPADSQEQAQLVLEMSGINRLKSKVQEALEASSILRGRVANAEYYFAQAVSETARCYARQMLQYKLDLSEFTQPPASLESRLFMKFQHEIRLAMEELHGQFKGSYFLTAQRYINGPMPAEIEKARNLFLNTIQWVIANDRQLIVTEQHISTGQTVTDAWRRVFENINDWLALEAGRQLRSVVGPILTDLDKLAGSMQKQLASLTISPLEDSFWVNYNNRLARLHERLQNQAEVLAIAYFTDNRFSVHDMQIIEKLHAGDGGHRREGVILLMQERVRSWFNNMWHLFTRIAMTQLDAFVGDMRHYILGLPADGSLQVGLELEGGPSRSQITPEESVLALLNSRYHSSESFRRQYAMREPTPAERLTLEIRDWLAVVPQSLDGLSQLSKALSMTTADAPEPANTSDGYNETDEISSEAMASDETVSNNQPIEVSIPNSPKASPVTYLRLPIESNHPYNNVTRQVWEITNPDPNATATRVHFSRVDLNAATDRLILQPLRQQQTQIITGQQIDFWSQTFPGRTIVVKFNADSRKPGWGFVLDAIETITVGEALKI